VTLTKTTTRAIAFSIALVAAGATVAGAAVFQLPILGFGRAAAGATAAPARRPVAPHKIRPNVIVKTRIVDDIVHRPAPTRAYGAPASTPSPAPMVAVSAANSTAVTAPTSPAVISGVPSASAGVRVGGRLDDGHEREHEDAPGGSGQVANTHAEISVVDQ
jgi:hypothetical protein